MLQPQLRGIVQRNTETESDHSSEPSTPSDTRPRGWAPAGAKLSKIQQQIKWTGPRHTLASQSPEQNTQGTEHTRSGPSYNPVGPLTPKEVNGTDPTRTAAETTGHLSEANAKRTRKHEKIKKNHEKIGLNLAGGLFTYSDCIQVPPTMIESSASGASKNEVEQLSAGTKLLHSLHKTPRERTLHTRQTHA